MKELKTKKSAEGARVKEKSDALPRAAKRMLRAGLMERQASRQRDTQEKAPERAAEEQVELRCGAGRRLRTQAGRYSGKLCICEKMRKGQMHGQRTPAMRDRKQRKFPEIGKF